MNLKLFKHLCQLTQNQLLEILSQYLKKYYDNVIATEDYIVAEGQIPVALVAHLDTVGPVPPQDIFYDQEANVMWSPQLLGADDRAGVISIIELIERGYRPHIIFTTDEEKGCIGASKFIVQYKKCPFKKLKAIIQLDRKGEDDAVYYNCNNKSFERFINSHGFITEQGSFTDISVIAPEWGIAAVNLSVGYIGEHTLGEHIHIDWLEKTIDKVCKILEDIDSYDKFKYIPGSHCYNTYFPIVDDNTCYLCQRKMKKKNKVLTPDMIYVCKECYKEYYG